MATFKKAKVTTTLVNGQTQYVSAGGSGGTNMDMFGQFSWSVDHPGGGTTTVYSIQASNMTQDEVTAGRDDWFDDPSAPTIPSKTVAEKFGIKVTDAGYARYRLKAVTSAGGGATTVREIRKAF